MATQEDVYSMYHKEDPTYYVDLTCEGEKTTFFVDTGFYNVTITPE